MEHFEEIYRCGEDEILKEISKKPADESLDNNDESIEKLLDAVL